MFFLCSAQYQTKTKFTKNQVGEFFFYKTLPLPFAWSSKGFLFACRPNSYDQISSFLSDQNFSFSTKCSSLFNRCQIQQISFTKKGRWLSVLWGIKKRSNRFWNLKAFLKKSKLYLGSSSDTTWQFLDQKYRGGVPKLTNFLWDTWPVVGNHGDKTWRIRFAISRNRSNNGRGLVIPLPWSTIWLCQDDNTSSNHCFWRKIYWYAWLGRRQ